MITVPFVGCEMEIPASTSSRKQVSHRSVIGKREKCISRFPNIFGKRTFDYCIQNWLLDSDSENDSETDRPDDYINPIASQQLGLDENDLTDEQLQVLQTEDRNNDTVLQELLPDNCFLFTWT